MVYVLRYFDIRGEEPSIVSIHETNDQAITARNILVKENPWQLSTSYVIERWEVN